MHRQVVATYTVAAPHGSWSYADNGSYTIALKSDQVTDTKGNPAGGASSSFAVNTSQEPPSRRPHRPIRRSRGGGR